MAADSLQISFADAPDQIRDLAAWLRSEDELRGRVDLVKRPLEAGHMGGIADTLSIAVGSGGAVAVSVRSFFAWLSVRHAAVRTRIELKAEDGRAASIELTGSAEPEAVLDELTRFFRGGGE